MAILPGGPQPAAQMQPGAPAPMTGPAPMMARGPAPVQAPVPGPMANGMGLPMPPMAPPPPQPPPMFHDVKIRRTRKTERALVTPVPPEEFGISSYARSIRDTGYCFHDVVRRESELINDGYDKKQIEKLTPYTGLQNNEELSRDTVEERQGGGADSGLNTANRELRITEHYIVMDYEGNGKPCMYKVVTGGEPSEILSREGEDDVQKWEGPPPFAAGCPFPMPHRFFGRSIADLLMDIQRIKTAVIRGGLNNIYMRTNPRVEVSESNASINTLDDLLTMRPGGVVRTKTPGGINWQEVPDVTASLFPALQYFDAQREWRTGVTRQGQGVDPNALQNQVATIANQMEDASQSKVKMIARILAETGIRDMFSLLHATIRRHGSIKQTVELRGKWVTVDPRDWKARNQMTINIGLGNGSKASLLAQIQMLLTYQQQAVQIGMVTKGRFYNSVRDLVRLIKPGGDANAYFVDPSNPPDPNDPPLQPATDPKTLDIQGKMQIEASKQQNEAQAAQMKMALEDKQAQDDSATERLKQQGEAQLAAQKHAHDVEIARIHADIKQRESAQKMQHQAALTAQKLQLAQFSAASKASEGSKPAASDNSAQFMEVLKAITAPRIRKVVRHPKTGMVESVEEHPIKS